MSKLLDKHWDKYVCEIGTGCKIWTGALRSGRPTINIGGTPKVLARLVCKEANGPPPTPKHEAAHKPPCRNVLCVEGSHLYWATRSQNQLDERDYSLRYIYRRNDGIFQVRVKWRYVGIYSTLEEAMKARDEYELRHFR